MFMKFECGCVAFVVVGDPAGRRVYCVRACYADSPRGDDVAIFEREDLLAETRPRRKLDSMETIALLLELQSLVSDGNRLRELRTAMRAAGLS